MRRVEATISRVFLVLLLALAGVAFLAITNLMQGRVQPPTSTWNGKIVKTVDGDTIKVERVDGEQSSFDCYWL